MEKYNKILNKANNHHCWVRFCSGSFQICKRRVLSKMRVLVRFGFGSNPISNYCCVMCLCAMQAYNFDQRQRNAPGRRLKMAADDPDDVTRSVFYGGDVIDDVSGGVTNHSGAGLVMDPSDQMTSGCLLYKFVVDCINGLVCVLGLIGNLIAFVVFYKDTMKTSTSFLFQVSYFILIYHTKR